MISGYNNILDINNIFLKDNNAIVFGIIKNYKKILKRVPVGESITTTEPFSLSFPPPIGTSKWMLFFYPNGQYDFGFASDNCRFYVKMVSWDSDHNILTTNINFRIKSSLNAQARGETKMSEFNPKDIWKNWAGPFEMSFPKDIQMSDNLMVRCEFEINSPVQKATTAISTCDKWRQNIGNVANSPTLSKWLRPKRRFHDLDSSSNGSSIFVPTDLKLLKPNIKKNGIFSPEERAEIQYKKFLGPSASKCRGNASIASDNALNDQASESDNKSEQTTTDGDKEKINNSESDSVISRHLR